MHNQISHLICAMIACTGQNLSYIFRVTFSVKPLNLFQKENDKQLDYSVVSCATKSSYSRTHWTLPCLASETKGDLAGSVRYG